MLCLPRSDIHKLPLQISLAKVLVVKFLQLMFPELETFLEIDRFPCLIIQALKWLFAATFSNQRQPLIQDPVGLHSCGQSDQTTNPIKYLTSPLHGNGLSGKISKSVVYTLSLIH